MGQVAFIMHLTKSKFEAMCKKQFATTYQKIRGKLINEKGAKLRRNNITFCVRVTRWMQIQQPNHLNHMEQALKGPPFIFDECA